VNAEHHVWANWSISVALGGVRIEVPISLYENAKRVIENIDAGVYEEELVESEIASSELVCPKSSSPEVMPRHLS